MHGGAKTDGSNSRRRLNILVSGVLSIILIKTENISKAIADHSPQPRASGEASKLKDIPLWGMGLLICGNEGFARARFGRSSEKSRSGNAELAVNIGGEMPEEFRYCRHTAADDSDNDFGVAR